jgi:hypothetical protein
MRGRHVLAGIVAGLLLAPGVARAADVFNEVVRRVESRTGARRMRTPGVGLLVNGFMFFSRPTGASSMQLAVWDASETGERFQPDVFQAAVRESVRRDWTPVLRVTSARGREEVAMFARAKGGRFEVLLATSEPDEGTLIQMTLDGRKILDWLRNPGEVGRGTRESAGIQ